MRAIATGDRIALAAFYDRHSAMVLAVCTRVLQDASEAEDVVVDVFFEIWTRADRYNLNRGSPLAYLLILARSRSIDRKRSRGIRPGLISDSAAVKQQPSTRAAPAQSTDLNEQRQLVRAALESLEPAQRQALECSFYDDLSHSEIAQRLNKPLGTVKTYIRQGLIRLRENLRNKQ